MAPAFPKGLEDPTQGLPLVRMLLTALFLSLPPISFSNGVTGIVATSYYSNLLNTVKYFTHKKRRPQLVTDVVLFNFPGNFSK